MKRGQTKINERLDSRRSLPRTQMRGGNDKLYANVRKAFTLVEILTTIAIVGILLALLIPALSAVQDTAMKVKQRAQFHSIEVGLEAFYTDTGDYPPSEWNQNVTTGYGMYSASQRLAEALIGRDGFGFHPDSTWNESGEDAAGNPLYFPDFVPADDAERDANLALRLGPYLELETANAVKLSNLYGSALVDLVDSYVLVDMYKITKNSATGKMVGSPLLYYRADTGNIQHAVAYAGMGQCIYNAYDSIGSTLGSGHGIARQVPLSTKTGSHPMATMLGEFYEQTTNPNFPGDPSSGVPPRPYRAESFLLQSAGPDSLYGTSDDVFNFDQEE